MEERRRSARADLDLRVVIHFDGPEDIRGSKTADISQHGVLIRTKSSVPLGTTVYLEFDIGPETIAVDGRVVRILEGDDGVIGIGVEFTAIGEQAAERLAVLTAEPAL